MAEQSLPLSERTIVFFEHDGSPYIGVVTTVKDEGKVTVLSERGKQQIFSGQRLLSLNDKLQRIDADAPNALTSFRELALKEVSPSTTQEIWEVIHEEEREYEVKELSELFFSESTPSKELGLRLRLLENKTHFKRHTYTFSPRPPALVQELLAAEEAKRVKETQLKEGIQQIALALQGEPSEFSPSLLGIFQTLGKIAAHCEEISPKEAREGKEFLSNLQKSIPQALLESHRIKGDDADIAYFLLQALKIFKKDENLFIIRHLLRREFSGVVQEEAQNLDTSIHQQSRKDLTHLDAFTVDDAKTLDIDDALSVEELEKGFCFGIHITDVASALLPQTVVEREGKARATSLYFANQTIAMLPEILSEERLSLIPEAERHALSVLLYTDKEYNLLSWSIAPSIIRSRRRVTYQEIDERLEKGDAVLLHLYNLASTNEARRISLGARKVEKRDALVEVDDNGKIKLVEVDEEASSRVLVSEMMVIYNEVLSLFAMQQGIALPFRGQEPPEDQSEPQVPQGPAYDYALRIRLNRSVTDVAPRYHATLGLKAYTQATSPLRRYLDLCAQRQVLHYLIHGSPFYSPEELQQIIHEVDQPLQRANYASREAKRYWLLRYLEERTASKTSFASMIRGTIVRKDQRVTLAELEEVYLQTPVRAKPRTKIGDSVLFKIVQVDARKDLLKLEEVDFA